jgi:hypothetical protein
MQAPDIEGDEMMLSRGQQGCDAVSHGRGSSAGSALLVRLPPEVAVVVGALVSLTKVDEPTQGVHILPCEAERLAVKREGSEHAELWRKDADVEAVISAFQHDALSRDDLHLQRRCAERRRSRNSERLREGRLPLLRRQRRLRFRLVCHARIYRNQGY